jgi:hypothetical protein
MPANTSTCLDMGGPISDYVLGDSDSLLETHN